MTTYIKPSRDSAESFFVETWYDRYTRSWITQTKTADWDQIGQAQYDGNKRDAMASHTHAVDALKHGGPISVLHTFLK